MRMAKLVQIRDVPDEVHASLVHKASAQGLSLAAYLRQVLVREAERSTVAEVLARSGGRARGVTLGDVVALVREGRDAQ